MSDIDFKMLVYLFVLCTTLFQNQIFVFNPKHLNMIEDLEAFVSYDWVIEIHEEILLELATCKEQLDINRKVSAKT